MPRARLNSLTDGIYAVAMTLLVLDLHLPDDFHPADSRALVAGLAVLWPKFLPYALSFVVLSLSWLAKVEERQGCEAIGRPEAYLSLLHLFAITCIPFTTIVMGRFIAFAPAIWLYAANIFVMALVTVGLSTLFPAPDDLQNRRTAGLVLAISAACVAAMSLISPHHALWAFGLNALPLRRLHRRPAKA